MDTNNDTASAAPPSIEQAFLAFMQLMEVVSELIVLMMLS
jgi:hypothetical protein